LAVLKLDESFSWMFQDRGWRIRFLLQGLILLIPVVGVIALLGWMLANLENLRDGRCVLARNGLYLANGIEMFCVWLIYSTALLLPWFVLATVAVNVPPNPTISGLSQAALVAGLLALGWLMPAMIVATDRAGFLVGVGPGQLLRESRSSLFRTTLAAAAMVAAFLIGAVGFLCFVGALVTLPYAATVMAAVAAWWERPMRPAEERAPMPTATPAHQIESVASFSHPPAEGRGAVLPGGVMGRLRPVAPPPPSLLRPPWLERETQPAPPPGQEDPGRIP
jgi:hypothetical protein